MGKCGRSEIPLLRDLLKDTVPEVQKAAQKAIAVIMVRHAPKQLRDFSRPVWDVMRGDAEVEQGL